MRSIFSPVRVFAYILRPLLPVIFLCSVAFADGEISMFRYTSKTTGREVYAAKTSQRKVMDNKAANGGWIVQQVGYVYAEQRAGTTALYGLILSELGGGPARVTFTFSETEYKNLTSKNSPKKWKPYFSDSPIVAYVLLDDCPNCIGAYYMSSPEPDLRLRFGSKEYAYWNKLPGNSFDPSGPSFYIFMDKPEKPKEPEPKKAEQTLRQYLYILGKSSVFSKNAKYASVGMQLALDPKNAKSCDNTGCTFYVGVMVSRSVTDEYLTTYITLTPETGGYGGNSTAFNKGEGTTSMVYGLKLHYGVNTIKVDLKPYLPKDDTNKENNTATFSLMLNK